jgi:hypothetical protein
MTFVMTTIHHREEKLKTSDDGKTFYAHQSIKLTL